MRVIVCCESLDLIAGYSIAIDRAGMSFDSERSKQEFGSRLYRDHEAMGVLVGPPSIAGDISELRQAQVKNRLIALVEKIPYRRASFESDLAAALYAGADDAQSPQINLMELCERLKAVARRGRYFDHRMISLAGGVFDTDRGVLDGPEASVRFSNTERLLLMELARRQSETLTKHQLLDATHPFDPDPPEDKLIDVFICKVRAKVALATGGLDVIATEWGKGFRIVPDGFMPERQMARVRGRA